MGRRGIVKTQKMLVLSVVLGSACSWGQARPGAIFGARDPAVCPSRKAPAKGAPTVDQAKAYFHCDNERVDPAVYASHGSQLWLVSELKLEVAPNSRPFNLTTDSTSDIDPKQPVYNIRGSYAQYQCMTPDAGGGGTYPIGKNCVRRDLSKVEGMCYKNTFADWHCVYQRSDPPALTPAAQPAPTQ
jgi:hypothetical protein